MKIFFRRIHLYLGLAAGAVILVACLTGAVLVFEKDLQMALNKDRYYVKPEADRLPISSLTEAVTKAYPGSKIGSVKWYQDSSRSVEVNITPALKGKQKAATGGRAPGYTIFVNPYTGQLLDKYSYRETFFYKVFALHRWLLGSEGSIGKYIVGISTLVFLFIIITGLILWWPKTRRILQQRLRLQWDGGWKRINHDLHIVLGFYSSIFLFIIAFTGLAWSFQWFNNGIYKVTNSAVKALPPPKSSYAAGLPVIGLDTVQSLSAGLYPQAVSYSIVLPRDSAEVFTVSVLEHDAVHESATHAIYFDQYSGAVLGKMEYAQRSLGARVRSTFKPVHTGSIGGWPTKILAFIVCVLGASFPVTGTILWLNRTRKSRKTN